MIHSVNQTHCADTSSTKQQISPLAHLSGMALSVLIILMLSACSSDKDETKEEQISIDPDATGLADSSLYNNSIQGNLSLSQISSTPHRVVLTGLQEHRLVTVYKLRKTPASGEYYGLSRRDYYELEESELQEHFMPGIDLIHGYNLLNIAHYDLTAEKLNFLFDHPVLVKSLYYPSFVQDSLYKKPINRNYYLVSAYDGDTNGDTLINKSDLRRFYYFNAACVEKIQLVPVDYSVVRSQYDPPNDLMYIFARYDANKNGAEDKQEPVHVFWISLKQPAQAKRLY